MELRAGLEIGWVDPESFAEMFLAGRAKTTFPTYDLAFRKLWHHGIEIEKCIFRWSPMDMAGYLVLLNDCEATVNMVKQASAVVTLFKEALELESLAGSRLVQTVKKGVMKAAREREAVRKKKAKAVMTLDHVWLLICKLFKRPALKVKPADRRFLMMMILMFFGMKRFDDIKQLRVCDIRVLNGGHLEFYVERSKTDQMGQDFVFHVTGENFRGFSIPKVLNWYLDSTGLRGSDYLFPRFRYEKGKVIAQGGYFISYNSSALQLKNFCIKNRIPVLTMHSGRRGGVTAAVGVGVDRMSIKAVGNWSSDVVDSYYCPRRVGVNVTELMIKEL